MYPQNYFKLETPFPKNNKVFVVMSFLPIFDNRWLHVIKPAINNIKTLKGNLVAHRVDLKYSGDSILTEILCEIANCKLIIADITSIGKIDNQNVRNSNVFYELGLAHSVRLPEEVILLRSDNDNLPFDISNVRVNQYDPDGNRETAKAKIVHIIENALNEINLRKSFAIEQAMKLIDPTCWQILGEASREDGMENPMLPSEFDKIGLVNLIPKLSAIDKLLSIGALESVFQGLTPEHFSNDNNPPKEILSKYKTTEFGLYLYNECNDRVGLFKPEILEAIKANNSNKL